MTTAQAPVCPKCRSPNVVPIGYGYPTPETEERAKRGEVARGGCIIPPPERWADHTCRACGHDWAVEPYPWETSKAKKPRRRR